MTATSFSTESVSSRVADHAPPAPTGAPPKVVSVVSSTRGACRRSELTRWARCPASMVRRTPRSRLLLKAATLIAPVLLRRPKAGGFAYAQPPARCILNHFHPLELFLTHRHHPYRVTKSRCS